jgi:Uma2 family endonuclease
MATAEAEVRTNRDEFLRMVEAGVFEDRRVELVDGVVYDMTPQLSPHASAIRRCRRALQDIFSPAEYEVDAQLPLDLGHRDMPEPDLAVVLREATDYYASHPTEAALVVEVADTSLYHDRKRKGRMYAEAGIEDYWILNLARNVLEVYRNPAEGEYRTRSILHRGEQIAPLARPDALLAVDDLLPLVP